MPDSSSEINHPETPFTYPGLETYQTKPFDIGLFRSKMENVGFYDEQTLINAAKTMENLLGIGGNGNVYKIPKMEGYVLKASRGNWGIDSAVIRPIETVEDPFPTLNVGQAVARVGNNFILKEQFGIPAGVPYGEIRSRNEEEGNILYERSLALAASMPQHAYDNLAFLFKLLNEHYWAFDPSKANNILIDKNAGKFNVVDLHPLDKDQHPSNNFMYMTITLMDNAWRVTDPALEKVLIQYRKEILTKSFEASKMAQLPIPTESDSSLEYSFVLSGLAGKWPEYRAELQKTSH